MDQNAKLDGFLVHPLDVFHKAHLSDNNETANLDGFNVHPIDSFINHKNDPYIYLNNNDTEIYDESNTLINNTNPYPTSQELNTDLYSPYFIQSNDLENQTSYYLKAKPTINTGIDYNQNQNISSNYFENYETPSKIYNQFNTDQYIKENISYDLYPTKISTNFTGTNNQKYDYLQNSSFNNNLLNLKPNKFSNINNYDGDYYISSPNYSKTKIFPINNNDINNGIYLNKYSSETSYISPSSDYNTYSLEKIMNNISTQQNKIYNISTVPHNVSELTIETYPIKTLANGKKLNTYNSTPNIFKNTNIPSNNNLFVKKIQYPIYSSRAHSAPRKNYPTKTSIIVPSKTKVILPKPSNIMATPTKPVIIPIQKQPILQRSKTPIINNNFITSIAKNKNSFYTPKKNAMGIPLIVPNTGFLPSSKMKMLTPRTITSPSIMPGVRTFPGFKNVTTFNNNAYAFSPIHKEKIKKNNISIYGGSIYKPKDFFEKYN